jgi:Tol biopolymer transport system component
MTVTVSPLTTQPGVEAFPSLSPDGKWVVYSSAAAGNADIYLQSATGQVPINLTKDSMLDDTQPALSPDGERIAFRSERDGGGLFVMGRTGESPRRLTDRGFNPAWSPDGRALVYATMSFVEPLSRVGNRSELWVVDIASGMTRRLAEPDAVQPSWSPHGHRVAYWGIPLGGSQRDLWTIPVTGGPAVRVTDDAAVDWNPVWAPDGGALFFASDRGGAMNLWRVAIDETSGRVRGEPVPITAPAQNVGEFSVSGDGRRLAYAAVQESSNLWSIAFDPVAGRAIGDARPLTSGSNRYSSVTVSPDGRRLAFTSLGRQEDLVVSRADGSELRQLTNDAAKDRSPAWAPDGTRIAFYSDRGGKYEVWTIRPDGSDLRQLTRTTATTGDPIWSPDGSRMIVSDSSGAVLLIDPSKPWTDQQPEVLPRWEGEGTFSAWRWSPDGRRLAGNVGPTPRDGIVVFDLERRVYRRILEVGQRPVWLRDSARMLFSAGSDIRIVDLRTGKAQVVMQIGNAPAAFGGGFDLSGDNRTLYFRRYVREADVWVADIKPGAE